MEQKEVIKVIKDLIDCPEHSTSKWHVDICANKLIEKLETKQLILHDVSSQREQLIAFLEMNNWLSLEDRKNAEGVVDCYLKAINCG